MTFASREQILRRRIRWLTWVIIIGLVFSGVTALLLPPEANWLVELTNARQRVESANVSAPGWALWLVNVQSGIQNAAAAHPFLFYGTDWLAFGHFVIALSFVGALRDPVRNRWLFTFGMIACAMVLPYAFTFGAMRGIPVWWRLIDCSFGAVGFVPLWLCRKWSGELERSTVVVAK